MFYRRSQKEFSRWQGVFKKNYRSKADALKAAETWEAKAKII